MAFLLHNSNSLEILAKKLAMELGKSSNPFASDTIITQTPGMQRWLSLQIAKENGICAHVEFISPQALLSSVAADMSLQSDKETPWDAGFLRYIVLQVLETSLIERKECKKIKEYIAGDDLKRWQLAGKIADNFDQYMVYRPEMIYAWDKDELIYEKSKDEVWQQIIWKAVSNHIGEEFQNRLYVRDNVCNLLQTANNQKQVGFDTIHIFGITTLSAYYLDFMDAVSNNITFCFYLLNPSKEYWGYIVSEKELSWKKRNFSIQETQELYYEKGNTLLANMGSLGRDFYTMLYDKDPMEIEEELFVDPITNNASLLQSIQKDILFLGDNVSETVSSCDDSIVVQSAYTPMREVEMLRDWLLSQFENDNNLEPGDILVMTPDIDTYAPFIDAVFSNMPQSCSIPFTIADRTVRFESRVADLFLSMLDLITSRFEASVVCDIFESEVIHLKFDIDQNDLGRILRWIKEANVKWGINEQHKEQKGLPANNINTWQSFFDRVLIGYAYNEEDSFYDGVYPYTLIEGGDAKVLGRFLDFLQILLLFAKEVTTPKTLLQWGAMLEKMLDTLFFANEEHESQITYLRNAVHRFKCFQEVTHYKTRVDFSIVKSHFNEYISRNSYGRGFITGAVTFCSMKPMRSIPFRNICMLGINDDSFPRKVSKSGFDLLLQYPRKGDRNMRDSDRYLFLETLLSARDNLYISFIGRNIQNNEESFPSIILSELLDYCEEHYNITIPVIQHPLQSFSKRYYDDSPLFTYNVLAKPESSLSIEDVQTDDIHRLGEPEEGLFELSITDLVTFFKNPAAALLRKRLGVYLTSKIEEEVDTEIFTFDALQEYGVKKDIIEQVLQEKPWKDIVRQLLAKGRIPHGNSGKVQIGLIKRKVEPFIHTIAQFTKGAPELCEYYHVFHIHGKKITISEKIDRFYKTGTVLWRPTKKAKNKDLIESWIYHLFTNHLKPQSRTYFIGEEAQECFDPVNNPVSIIERLLAIYVEGIKSFLPFSPEISFKLCDLLQKNIREHDAFNRAIAEWNNPFNSEKEDENLKLAFSYLGMEHAGDELIDASCHLATQFYSDLLQHRNR